MRTNLHKELNRMAAEFEVNAAALRAAANLFNRTRRASDRSLSNASANGANRARKPLSKAARERIAKAQRARWAAIRAGKSGKGGGGRKMQVVGKKAA